MKKILILLLFSFRGYCQTPEEMFHSHNVTTVTSCATDADAAAFISATGISDATICTAVDNYVIAAKAHGYWSKKTAIYVMVGGTSTTCKYNLKDPRDLDAAYRLTFANSPTFSSSGVDWNGTSQYGDTHLASNVMGQNSMNMTYWSGENVNEPVVDMGADNGSIATDIQLYSNVFYSYNRSYVAGYASYSLSTTIGMFATNRIVSTDFDIIVNGSQVANKVVNSSTPGAISIYIGAEHTTPSMVYYSTKRCQYASIGDGLTSTEYGNEYTDVAALQTALGR